MTGDLQRLMESKERHDAARRRVAFGAALALLHQSLDNGDLEGTDIDQYLPEGLVPDSNFYSDLDNAIQTIVMPFLEAYAKI